MNSLISVELQLFINEYLKLFKKKKKRNIFMLFRSFTLKKRTIKSEKNSDSYSKFSIFIQNLFKLTQLYII